MACENDGKDEPKKSANTWGCTLAVLGFPVGVMIGGAVAVLLEDRWGFYMAGGHMTGMAYAWFVGFLGSFSGSAIGVRHGLKIVKQREFSATERALYRITFFAMCFSLLGAILFGLVWIPEFVSEMERWRR